MTYAASYIDKDENNVFDGDDNEREDNDDEHE